MWWRAGNPDPKTCVGLHGLTSAEQYGRLNKAAQKVANDTNSVDQGLYPVVVSQTWEGPAYTQMTVGTHNYVDVPSRTVSKIWTYACSTEVLPGDKPTNEQPLVAENTSDPMVEAIEKSAKDITDRDLQVMIDPSNTGGAPVITFYENDQPARVSVSERYRILNAAASGDGWDRTTRTTILNLQTNDANGSRPPTDDGEAVKTQKP